MYDRMMLDGIVDSMSYGESDDMASPFGGVGSIIRYIYHDTNDESDEDT